MAPVGKYAATGRGGKMGVKLVLTGGDKRGPNFWIRVLGAIRRNIDYDGEYPCGSPMTDHEEAGETERRSIMEDTGVRGGATDGGD